MPSRTLAGGALRVVVPSSYDAEPSHERRQRDLPTPEELRREADKEAMLAALAHQDYTVVDRVDLTPRRGRGVDDIDGPGRPPANRVGTASFEVDVPAGEDAVVLLEQGGLYSWHLPVDAGHRTRSIDPGPRTARFEIAVQPSKPTRRRKPAGGPGASDHRRDRGLLGDVVRGAVQAIVLRFVAPVVVGKAIEHLERSVRPGLVHLKALDVSQWTPFETLDELDLPTDRDARVLLLVHGTFSSTVGGFGALGVTEGGRWLLEACLDVYDAVIGFDHKTLSLDPRQNAEDLLTRLSAHTLDDSGLVIDIITHSRGGLTTRSFVEEVLPPSTWQGTVDSVVFVAATNAGTSLADPKRWHDLVDLYTNIAAVTSGVLALVPGAAPVVAVVNGLLQGIGAFVKWLVSYAAEGEDVPGLKAMMPGGTFVTRINAMQPGQPHPGTNWHVVSSNFHVTMLDDSHRPPEFPRELVVRLAEGFVDRIFDGDNDLVVDTKSMSAIGLPTGRFTRDGLDLGTNDVVYHGNYFNQRHVVEHIAAWLPLGLGSGGDEASVDGDLGSDGGGDRGLEMAEPPPLLDPDFGNGGPEPLPPPPPSSRPPELTPAHLAAEMPAHVQPEQEFDVRVRMSRKEIRATEGTVSDDAGVIHVDEERPLTVQVLAKQNAEVVGSGTDVFELPAGGGVSELVFSVKALAVGAVVVKVVVRQGRVPIADLRLEGEANSRAAFALPPPVKVEVHTGIDAPELEALPCLDIVERRLPDGSVVLHYALRIEPGTKAVSFTSDPIVDRARAIGTILDQTQDLVSENVSPTARLRRLQSIGSDLFERLFPEEMQAYLWERRDRIADLIVYADEPYVPWELVHLKPPRGPRGKEVRFLAQAGLVRWRLGSFPPREIRIRRGRARSLCPDYRDPRFVLREPVHEAAFLEARFGAKAVRATPAGVVDLLRSGRFDLLHFSGHGAADSDEIVGAKVLLQGRKRGRRVEPEYLTATDVSENARLSGPDQPGPVVVLNSCKAAQSGVLLTNAGGFADAFLGAGASVFVSCLWSAADEPARTFVEKLYDELLVPGTTVAAAVTRARQTAREAGDATWLGYAVYARPDAVLTTG